MKVVSLFSGAMGLDLGLEKAGHEIVVAVETDPVAVATIRKNRPDIAVIARPIETISTQEILQAAGLRNGQNFIVAGGPCCQAFSTVGKRASLGDPRGSLFLQFVRVVREAQPAFFLMENVRGLLSAAERHRPLNRRGPNHPPLDDDELLGSAFAKVVTELRKLGYYTVFDVLNAADYGVPQQRERFIALGSRDGRRLEMPTKTHARDGAEGLPAWRTLKDALGDAAPDRVHVVEALNKVQARCLPLVPEGGNWRALPVKLQKLALGKAYESWGGRTGFLRRLAWDRPAPSLVTLPTSRATFLGHPVENRTLSTFEYARIQQFPDDWQFHGPTRAVFRQIGNAVPIGLGAALGQALAAAAASRRRTSLRGVFCHNEELLQRLGERPAMVLNPPRMREGTMVRGEGAAVNGTRAHGLRFVNRPLTARQAAARPTGRAPKKAAGKLAVRQRSPVRPPGLVGARRSR